jgi:carbon monoxide dehydrogenase subunit G
MKIEQKFALNAPRKEVWAFLTNPYEVAGCLPGATISEKVDDQTYLGIITVKVGPVTASYKGKIRFERLDHDTHEAEIVGQGQDIKGKGSAEMRMMSRLYALEGGGTEVSIVSAVNLSGLLAQFGRGMIEDVSDQLFKQFAATMKSRLEAGALPEPRVEPVNVLSLGSKAFGRSLVRSVRRIFGFSNS